MAQFTGFTCDGCGEVISSKDRFRETLRIEHDTDKAFGGEVKRDLCKPCAEGVVEEVGESLQPLRRRAKKDDGPGDEGGVQGAPTEVPTGPGDPAEPRGLLPT